MSIARCVLLAVASLLAASGLAKQPPTPKFGEVLAPEALQSITVWPDGQGLPIGQGSVSEGIAVYQTHCQACHGMAGQGGINDALVGGQTELNIAPSLRTIGSYWPYATTIYDYVRRSMPYNAPGSLSADQTYAVVAYLLYLNGVIAEDASLDAEHLAKLKLANHPRFYSDYPLP